MDCFGTYFTHVQKALLWTWQPAHMKHTKYTAVRLLKTCTWQPAHMEHTKYTAVRTKVYIQQNHSACTDEAPDRVYRRGRYPGDPGQNHPRVLATLAQNHPRVLATPESACAADPLTSRVNFIKYCPCMPLPRKSYNAISQHIAPATKNDTATSLHSSLTALFLGWTLPWQDPSLIELFLDGTLPWGNSSLTELLLNWTVPWLKSARTVGAKGRVFPEALTLSALAGGWGGGHLFLQVICMVRSQNTAFLGLSPNFRG